MVGPSRPVIVLFGSSITQLSFSNGGWGATLADIYSRKDASVQPSLVIVYFGGNDATGPHPSGLGPHVPLPEYVENMRKVAAHLKSLSETTRIIFLSCPPVGYEIPKGYPREETAHLMRTNESSHEYSEALIELCNDMDVNVVNLFTAVQKRDGWRNVCFTDGVHLSADGSNVVVEEVLKVIKEAEWQPSLYWKSMPTEFSEDTPYYRVAPDGLSTLNPSNWTMYRKIQWD